MIKIASVKKDQNFRKSVSGFKIQKSAFDVKYIGADSIWMQVIGSLILKKNHLESKATKSGIDTESIFWLSKTGLVTEYACTEI